MGLPSAATGRWMPCQWIVVGSGRLLVKRARRTSPALTRISGPGTEPL
jgi:hypothetical protein